MKKIAITNRSLYNNIFEEIEILNKADYDYIILRDKDIDIKKYLKIAEKAIQISSKIILHGFTDICLELKYKKVHLPFDIFIKSNSIISDFDLIGVSIHSIEQAQCAEKLGAHYITASHIFPTDCKKGLEPRGINWLKEVCDSVNIPVYALGGINSENAQSCIDAGASGICMMSEAANYCKEYKNNSNKLT